MITILTGVKGYLIAVLVYISLIISDIKHLYPCLLSICTSYLEKVYLGLLPVFLIGFLVCFWALWTICMFLGFYAWTFVCCFSFLGLSPEFLCTVHMLVCSFFFKCCIPILLCVCSLAFHRQCRSPHGQEPSQEAVQRPTHLLDATFTIK